MSQKLVLAAATLVALNSGTNYAFSAFGPALASRLHLNSKQSNLVAASGNAGVYLSGPFLGILCDKRGPRVALLIAAVSLLSGYLLLRAQYNGGRIGPYSAYGVSGLAFAEVLTGIGSSAGLSGAINGTSRSFSKERRGSAMAVVVAGFGLSAFLYSSLSRAFRDSDDPTSDFLLVLALGCGVSMLVGALFVQPILHPIEVEPSYEYRALEGDEVRLDAGLGTVEDVNALDRSRRGSISKKIESDNGTSGMELLRSRDFWLMFCFLGLLSGVGLMYLNNIGTIAVTLSHSNTDDSEDTHATQVYLVSLLSVANCLGRLCAGFLSDFSTHRAPLHLRFARIRWYAPVAIAFIASQCFGALATDVGGWRGLTVPTALTGFAYGALFAISPVVCLERFGISAFSTNNGLLTLAPSVFGNLANVLFGVFYDLNVDWTEEPDARGLLRRAEGGTTEHICRLGPACFASAFKLTMLMSFSALLVAVMLQRQPSMRT